MLFAGQPTYTTYKNFVNGALFGIGVAFEKGIMLDMTFWFYRKLKLELNNRYHWIDMIPVYYKDKSEEELMAILLQTLEEYVAEKL